jgi:hypothetical protein
LEHGVGLSGPDGELVGVQGELGLHALDDLLVLEEENLYRVSSLWDRTSFSFRGKLTVPAAPLKSAIF